MSGDSEKSNRQLHEIEGVFNFMQQPGLAGLLAVIREVFQKYPNQKNHTPPLQLIDEVFAKLLFFLGEVSLGQKVMAYQLLPVWQQLRPYLSDNSITPACLLSLDLLDVSHVETILNLITANTSEVIASTEDVEQALLDLLRAEVQTENLSRAAEIIFNAITEIYLRHPQLSQRCYWAVARRFVELMIRNLAANLPRSKKILSSVVRAIRQRSEIMWPALPDSLVKEILYQLAETDVDGDGQTVNAWFQIDAQLSGLSTKLRVDLLERASGSVAELLVNAVRSTDDLRQQKQLVVDLADNLARLRTQLRELELQSEASISSQSAPRASGFDPLEFDRYTRLQELTRMTAESMADLTGVQRSLAHQIDASLTMLVAQTRHARSLQSDLYRASTQAFSSIENRFRQLVRQVAMEVGRDVRFELDGGQLEIDRAHLESLNGPLSHLIRNAIAHGIEPADERQALGKPRQGLVFIKLSEQGAELRLQVIDDGRGLNFVRIREQAIARGLLSVNAEPDSDSLTQLIFESGFSTAEQVTGLAGRGIGMDAVKATIIAMGGAIKVESQSGLGTSVIMALPKSSSTQKILLVSDAHQKIALPSAMVQQVLSMSSASANQVITEGFIQWQDKKIALFALSDLIREPTVTHSATDRISFLILRQLDDWIAVKVGEVHGHHEVVVKPPGPQLASVPGLMGAAMLPDGDILLVMNLLQLHAHAVSNPIARSISATIVPEHVPPLVMVVDDSLTVRRVSQRMLEKHGYGVALARHGAHALELLSQLNPAAVLLDIEMPTMDGFELLSRLRSDERFRKLPVAMITSRMAERHRQHAMQLGANAYFGKPYREQELLEWLAQCAPVQNLKTVGNRTDHNQTLTSTA